MVWADKEKDLSVVLLTNRVFPNSTNSSTGILYARKDTMNEICHILGYGKVECTE
jgi:hypothetical protein